MQSFRLWGSGNSLSSWEQCYAAYMRILVVSLLLMTAGCSREPQSIDPERLELYTEIYAGADRHPPCRKNGRAAVRSAMQPASAGRRG